MASERNYADRFIIHATDRSTFKTCHKKYDYGHLQRLTRKEEQETPDYFVFGIAGHLALAEYQISGNREKAYEVFREAASPLPWTTVEDGIAILANYFDTSEPIGGEVIMVEDSVEIPYGDVTFIFTMDLVVKEGNSYTVVDHKFYSSFPSEIEVTQNDQASIYLWGMRKLGLWPARFMLNVIRKEAPQPPTVLKNGNLSVAKTQLTTPKLFREALDKYGLREVDYQEYVDWLEDRNNPFHHRYTVTRSSRELDLIDKELWHEIIAMTNPNTDAFFRNPGRACSSCQFYDICRTEAEGGDSNLMRQMYYRKKEDNER